jgi:filamentous hemagglutinin
MLILKRKIWTTTKRQPGVQNAFEHFRKHRSEFPEIQNATQYVKKAHEFLNNPPSGALIKIRSNGEVVIYDPTTNTFGIRLPDGTPKTMFRPDPAAHGYPTNLDYFNAQ